MTATIEDFEYLDVRITALETDVEEIFNKLKSIENSLNQVVKKVNFD